MDLLILLSVLAGLILLAVLVLDVFLTVFVQRGGPGPVTGLAYRVIWRCWRRMSRRCPEPRRRALLSLAGPFLVPVTVLLWATELVVGFALVYLPFVPRLSYPPGQAPLDPVTAALYVSGYSATTLGVGEVYATDALVRLVMTAEAGAGFALFSVSTAYLLSVYGAIHRSKALAIEVAHFLDLPGGSDAVDVLVEAVREGREAEVASWLSSVTSRLIQAIEAQEQYPLVQYFHVASDDRALPLSLPPLLELLTASRAMLDPDRLPELARSRGTAFGLRTATWYVTEGASGLRSPLLTSTIGDGERLACYAGARDRLLAAGIPLRPDEQARERYLEMRRAWDESVLAVLEHYGYPCSPCSGGTG